LLIINELLFTHIDKSGAAGAPLRELQQVLPSHSKRQIQILLNDLRGENRIELKGKTHGARWYRRGE